MNSQSDYIFWKNLLADKTLVRVIQDGQHYTLHHPDDVVGGDGNIYRIDWWSRHAKPSYGVLLHHGTMPRWVHKLLPDNAVFITALDDKELHEMGLMPRPYFSVGLPMTSLLSDDGTDGEDLPY